MTDLCIFCFKKQPLLPIKVVKSVKNKKVKSSKSSSSFNWKLAICDLFKLSIDLDDYLVNVSETTDTLICSDCTGDLKTIGQINEELRILNEKLQQVRAGFEDKIVQSRSIGGHEDGDLEEPFDSGVFEIRNMIFESIEQDRPTVTTVDVDVTENAVIKIDENNLDDLITIPSPSPFHDDNDYDNDVNIQSDHDQNEPSQENQIEMDLAQPLEFKNLSVLLEQIPLQKFTNTNSNNTSTLPEDLNALTYNVNDDEIVKFITNEKSHITCRKSKVKIKKTGPRDRKYRKFMALIPESIRDLRLCKDKDRELQCTSCQDTFRGKRAYPNLRQHYLWKHTGYNRDLELRFNCTMCSRSFISEYKLKKHIEISHTLTANGLVKLFSCSICKNSYPSLAPLTRHKRAEHGIIGVIGKHRNFKCKVKSCGSRFPSMYKLNMHMSKHSNLRPNLCQFCPAAYKTEISLKNHIRLAHTEGQTFPCTFEDCPRKFLTSKLLDEHVKEIHENQVRFVCTKCGKGFYNEKKLKSHILYHPDNLRYECTFCPKAYAKPDRLAQHMYTHNKERGLPDISCQYCTATFKSMHSKNRHIKRLHSSIPSASANASKVINDVAKNSKKVDTHNTTGIILLIRKSVETKKQ